MKTILITGGSGFIGSHTCLVLLEKGYRLIVIDSCVNSSPLSLDRVASLVEEDINNVNKKLHFVKGDIRSKGVLEKVFREAREKGHPIDAVIHFAGLKAVGESFKYPLLYWEVNVGGALNLFQVMESYGCRTIVFSSSATIYGYPKDVPIDETSPISPVNPYGYTKSAIENILKNLFASSPNSWRIACLRYFNPVGAHPSGKIGEDPLNIPHNLFPFISQVAVGRRKRLDIYGNDWPTEDGTCIRDYIHVMDLADGHYAALEYLFKHDSQILNLNLGTGTGTSVLEVVHTFQQVNKCSVAYRFVDRREGDVAISYADSELAKSILEWHPKRNIEDICRDGWAWQSMNPKGYIKK